MAAFMEEIKNLVVEAREINSSLDHQLANARKELKEREESATNLKAEFEEHTKLFKRKLDDLFNEEELRKEIQVLFKRLEVDWKKPDRVVHTDKQTVTSVAIKIPPSSSVRVSDSTTVVDGEDTLPSSSSNSISSNNGGRIINLRERTSINAKQKATSSEASKSSPSRSARVSDSTTVTVGEDVKPKLPSSISSHSNNNGGRIINLSERASINALRRLAGMVTASPVHGGGRPVRGGAMRGGSLGRVLSTTT